MIRAALRAVVVPAIAGAALLATLTPAAAASLVVKDESADTWSMEMTDDEEDFVQTGSKVNTDLRRTTVRHTAHRLSVKSTYEALKKRPLRHMSYHVAIKTSSRRWFVLVQPRRKGAPSFSLMTRRGREVECDRLTADVDFGADTARVSVPRSCLGTPRRVRVAVGAATYTAQRFYLDDATTDGAPYRLRWTAPVRVG